MSSSASAWLSHLHFACQRAILATLMPDMLQMAWCLPIKKLIVATNENDILARFLKTGRYEASNVTPTISPSMDIQVASNFERLLFDLEGRDGVRISQMMGEFSQTKQLEMEERPLAKARELFAGMAVSEDETKAAIQRTASVTLENSSIHTRLLVLPLQIVMQTIAPRRS